MDEQILCCKVVGMLIDADTKEGFSTVGNLISQSSCAKEIQEKFSEMSQLTYNSVAKPHQCPDKKVQRSPSRQPITKGNTFPGARGRSSYSESLKFQTSNYDCQSFASLPAKLSVQGNHSDSFSDVSSVFSDNLVGFGSAGNISSSSISTRRRSSHRFPAGDFDVYKASSLCVQSPVVAKKCLDKTEDIPLQERSLRSTRDILSHYLRLVFHPLSKDKHRQYQSMLFELDANSSFDHLTRLQLFIHLRQVEQNENPYYKPEHFRTKDDYQKWRSDEQTTMFKLLGNNFPSDKSVHDTLRTPRNRVDDYRSLLLKMLKHEAGCNIERPDSVSLAMSEIRIHISSSSSRESIHRGKNSLPPKAERLLTEFSQLYRVTAVTRHVIFLQCIKECCEDEILQFGDLMVLRDLKSQMSDLLILVGKTDENFILIPELESMLELTDHMIEMIKQLLSHFITQWKPELDQLTAILALLEKCCEFQSMFGESHECNFPDCVKRWFEWAIAYDYHSNKPLNCGCDDAFGQSPTLTLLRSVDYSIFTLQQNDCNYRSIFEQHVQNIDLLTAGVLYDCVLNDVAQLGESIRSKLQTEKLGNKTDLQASVVLASRLAMFEKLVFDTGYKLQDADVHRSWRAIFCELVPFWIQFVRSMIGDHIMRCVRDDESVFIHVPIPNSFTQNVTDEETSSAASSDCVITRVEEPNTSNAAVAGVDQRNYEDAGRLRMNTIIDHHPIESTHGLLSESRFIPEAGECIADGTAAIGGVRASETVSFSFSRSALDLVVALNRFIEFTKQTFETIYQLPNEWRDRKVTCTSKETFSTSVLSAMSSFIAQYSDCMLNLDLCKFPKSKVSQFVTRKKRRELKARRVNGTISCCRHQIKGNHLPCTDEEIKSESFLKKNALYSKMARRSNSLFLISEGLNSIWEQLSKALEIHQISSTGTSMRGYGSSTLSIQIKRPGLDYVDSDSSNTSEGLRGPNSPKINNVSSESRSSSTIGPSGASCDDNNNDHEGKRRIPLTKDASSPTHANYKRGRDRYRDRSSTSATCVASEPERCLLGGTALRVRSATEGCSSADSSVVGVLDNTRITIQETVKTDSQTLFRMLGFRIAQPVVSLLHATLNKFALRLKLKRSSLLRDLVTCEEHCQPVVALLSRVLQKITEWFCGHAVIKQVQNAIWKELMSKLSQETQMLKDFGESTKSRAFFLLMTYRTLLKVFNSFEILAIEDLSEDLQNTLSVLELFVMPTKQVVGLYNDVEEDLKNALSTRFDATLMRYLYRQQKSFAGHQFLTIVKSLSRKLDPVEVELEAQEMCSNMLMKGIIKLVFVRNLSKKKLPDLIEYGDSITSSCESIASDIAWQEKTPDSSHHTPTSNSSSGSRQESDNDSDLTASLTPFTPDFVHFYAFAVNKPLYHFNGPDGQNLRVDFLEEILSGRSRQDPDAKEFLRKKGKFVKKWFHFCSCI